MPRLTSIFVAHLSAEARAVISEDADIDRPLAEAFETARGAWPDVAIPVERFLAYLAARTPAEALARGAEAAVAGLRVADLYLACGCAQNDASALAAFERRYFPGIEAVVPSHPDRKQLADEVRQVLRDRLFVGQPEGEDGAGQGRIVDYAGRGDLAGWLRVAAARVALNLMRGEKRRAAAHEGARDIPVPVDDPEIAIMGAHYGQDLREAVREAAATLTVRERNLLRHHYIDGLTMVELAALYGLHRVSVVRALGRARDKLASTAREHLQRRLNVSDSELESILRVVSMRWVPPIDEAL